MTERDMNGNTEETRIVPVEEMELEEMQMVEQLYNSAGLDPVVDAGLKDYDEKIQGENKLLSKVLGPRASDIRGYGEAVARRVAFAVYALMNRQYGGKVGDLRSHIMALQDERDRANTRYDELMGRVVGILGEEYKELRSDSKVFMEKLTTVLGEDIKASKIDQQALAEKLADIDGLRNQIIALTGENQQLKQQHETKLEEQKVDYESGLAEQQKTAETMLEEQRKSYESRLEEQKKNYEASLEKQKESYESKLENQQNKHESNIEKLTDKHEKAVAVLQAKISGLESRVQEMETANEKLTGEFTTLKEEYTRLKAAASSVNEAISLEDLGQSLGEELHSFILEDSKVPDMVIDGVGKFIDFRKYFGMAAKRGAETTLKSIEAVLARAMKK